MDLGNLMQVLRAVYRFGCFEGYGRSVEAKPKQLESGNYTRFGEDWLVSKV